MFKRIMQSATIVVFMTTCLYFAPVKNESTNDQSVINEEVIVSDYKEENDTVDIVEANVDVVQAPMEPDEPIETEPVVEPEPPYYVDIVDGYITEDSIRSICEYVGAEYDISPNLLRALAWQESRYEVYATGSSGDKGLCQIVEKWHRDRIERLGVTDIYDPYGNILVCADILNELRNERYGYDYTYILMAYNMGSYAASQRYESGNTSQYALSILVNKASMDTMGM